MTCFLQAFWRFFALPRKSCTFVSSEKKRGMDKIRLKDKEFELFISENELQEAIKRMAAQIKEDVEGREPLFVGVLNGAFMFVADVMKALNVPYEVTFARYSSYRGTASTGTVKEVMPVLADIRGRVVVLLEDIIDTGFTMKFVKEKYLRDGAADVKLATMLFKPESLKCDITPDYVAMQIPSDFIVGHGLDYDELGRSYRDIYKVIDNC